MVANTELGAAVTGVINQVYVENHASVTHGNGSVGNVTLGNISVNAAAPSFQAGAVAEVTIYNGVYATNGKATVGSITVATLRKMLVSPARLLSMFRLREGQHER